MKQLSEQEKQLLLKDLAARLPYGVKCQVTFDEDNIFTETLESINMKYTNQISTSDSLCGVECIKPYLRSMSSMTSKEFEEYTSITSHITMGKVNYSIANPESFDWLNKNIFDYRGLIEKGLALEAPEGMYKLKEK